MESSKSSSSVIRWSSSKCSFSSSWITRSSPVISCCFFGTVCEKAEPEISEVRSDGVPWVLKIKVSIFSWTGLGAGGWGYYSCCCYYFWWELGAPPDPLLGDGLLLICFFDSWLIFCWEALLKIPWMLSGVAPWSKDSPKNTGLLYKMLAKSMVFSSFDLLISFCSSLGSMMKLDNWVSV